MFFRLVYDESLAQAAYIIGCQRTGEAIVIDPERDVDRYINVTTKEKLRIVAIGETHIHADYLSGARELAEQTGAKLYLSSEGGSDWQYTWPHHKSTGGAYQYEFVKNGSQFRIGNIQFDVLHTPGHTPEHICFLVTDTGANASEPMGIASGDFIFVGDVGRPDLLETAAGVVGAREPSARDLYRSVQSFLKLPDYLQVWPAHGAGSACGKALGAVPQSTVGYERRFNPALINDEHKFLSYVLEGQPEPPLYFARMKRLNKEGAPVLGGLPQPEQVEGKTLAEIAKRGATVIDTRSWAEFKHQHIKGSLFIPLDSSFATLAGSWIREDHEVALVVSKDRLEDAVRRLIRVGIDRVVAFVEPGALSELSEADCASSKEVEFKDAQRMVREGAHILDVRAPAEYQQVHIPETCRVTHTVLPAQLERIPRERPLIVHCQGGGRSARACSLLQRLGYDVVNLQGGISGWETLGGEVVRA